MLCSSGSEAVGWQPWTQLGTADIGGSHLGQGVGGTLPACGSAWALTPGISGAWRSGGERALERVSLC